MDRPIGASFEDLEGFLGQVEHQEALGLAELPLDRVVSRLHVLHAVVSPGREVDVPLGIAGATTSPPNPTP